MCMMFSSVAVIFFIVDAGKNKKKYFEGKKIKKFCITSYYFG